MRRCLIALLTSLCTLSSACTTTREQIPVNAESAVVQRLRPERAWRVVDADQTIGFVVSFVDPARSTRCSYSVRNPLHQELGTIDELGRTWRFLPHQRDAEWVCTTTLRDGTARLLGASAGACLEEVGLDELRPGDLSDAAN
jgi:hypothetical protein